MSTYAADSGFLGVGWAFPPTFSHVLNGAEMTSGEADVRQSLNILFGTRAGERIMRPDYGAHLGRLVFDGEPGRLTTDLRTRVKLAVAQWEPRVDLLEIDVEGPDPQTGVLSISLSYRIRGQNTRSNIVFPYYLGEATLVGQKA